MTTADAPAYLEVSRYGWPKRQFTWRIPVCPFCKLKHRHGGGVVGEDDPRQALGFRTPHCMNRPPDVSEAYKVTDLNPARTIEVLRELDYELT